MKRLTIDIEQVEGDDGNIVSSPIITRVRVDNVIVAAIRKLTLHVSGDTVYAAATFGDDRASIQHAHRLAQLPFVDVNVQLSPIDGVAEEEPVSCAPGTASEEGGPD